MNKILVNIISFTKNIITISLVILSTAFFSTLVSAADQTIEMLNKLGKENMVFSKKVVSIDVGDTVFWKATKPGHNVEFIKGGVPAGVDKFKSKLSKDTEYKFEVSGIYAYWCTPHKGMGMIGFVVVGNDKSNLDAVKKIKFMGKSKKIAIELINSL
jgi:pseudoazurin